MLPEWREIPDALRAKGIRAIRKDRNYGPSMLIGSVIFAAIAILCVVAGATVMKRNRSYGNSGGKDDDFDFDKFEGFDK